MPPKRAVNHRSTPCFGSEEARRMRDDEPDEADDARERHDDRHDGGREEHDEPLQAHDGHAEMTRFLLAEQEDVKLMA